MSNRKNIKLPEPLFNSLKDDKPDNMNWPTYFEQRCLGDDSDDVAALMNALETIEDRTGRIERQIDDLPKR